MDRQYAVYIMTNRYHTVLYTGVTNDLQRRVYQHKRQQIKGFTQKYNVTQLVWFETTPEIQAAILKEKRIKAGSRLKKIDLINALNPEWQDLSETLWGKGWFEAIEEESRQEQS